MKVTFLLCVILFNVIVFSSCSNNVEASNDIVFINTAKVFEQFQMKKDYDKKIEIDLLNETQLLDSIVRLINVKSEVNDTTMLNTLRQDYYIAEKLYQQKFNQLSAKYTAEVDGRLNEYIKKYSEIKDYSFMLGSTGQGNVMYVKDEKDITDDLIVFINSSYSK